MKAIVAFLEKLAAVLERIAELIVIVCFSVMVVAVLTGVATRNISISITWLEEIARYMQIWFVSVGFALALRKGMLAGTEVVLKALPERMAAVLKYVSKAIMAGFCVVMLVAGARLMRHLVSTGQLSPNMRIPIVWIYAGIYVAFGFALVFLLVSILVNTTGRTDELDRTFETVKDLDELDGEAPAAT